jgi:phage terminase Nu1 subunit (DNA packaging protein)
MSADQKSPSVDVNALAKLFDLTVVRVQQLAVEGIVVKSARGKYDLWKSIRGYIQYLQKRRVNQHDSPDQEQSDMKREQLRRTKEEADKLELQNARTRGEVIEVSKVEKLMQACFTVHRTRILNFPLTDDEKQACLADLLELKNIDWEREAKL